MNPLKFYLLGEFRIEKDGKPYQELFSPQIQALLAYLLAEHSQEHNRDDLLRLFWPNLPETTARNTLRVALFRLKSLFVDETEPLLLGSGKVLRLNPACRAVLDIDVFQSTAERYQDEFYSTGAIGTQGMRELIKVLPLYGGEFLTRLDHDTPQFNNWLYYKREQFRQYASWMNNRLLEFFEGSRQFEHCLKYTRFGLVRDPWDEKLHQQHMRFLTLTGQKQQALQHYQRMRQVFYTERGLRLSEETTALAERIERYESGMLPARLSAKTGSLTAPDNLASGETTAAAPASGKAVNFPPVSVAFVGRDSELEQLRQWLYDPAVRMMTLAGPGGVGKTQLAVQTALNNRAAFSDGVYYIPLEAPAASRLFASTLAHILGIETSGHKATQSQVLEALQNQHALLVLDNVRQFKTLEFFLRNLMERAPLVKLLLTARAPLGMAEESVLALTGLAVPPEGVSLSAEEMLQYPAVKLFDQFTQRLNIYQTQLSDEMGDIAAICRMLDGHPLGIELAANYTAVDDCAQILQAMRQELQENRAGQENMPPAQRCLRVMCDLSWNLLDAQEQVIFEKLSIFPGGYKREIAQLVAQASQHDLAVLKQHSFIDRSQKTGRYYVHPLLREYAAQRRIESNQKDASAEDAFRKAYCDFYLYFLYKRYLNLLNESNHSHVYEILYELPNIRQAWEEALYYNLVDALCRAAPALGAFYRRKGLLGEGMMEFEPLIAALRVRLQDRPTTEQRKEALLMVFLLIEKANFLTAQNSLEQARAVAEQALALARSTEDELGQMRVLHLQADIANRSNNPERALRQIEGALEIIRSGRFEFDSQMLQVWAAWCFELCADILTQLERYADALEKLGRAAFIYQSSDHLMQARLCQQKIKAIEEIQQALE